jgi:2-(1,2-epoxy-1,2-dihydrophenyl)acetyl-CoA isomerase
MQSGFIGHSLRLDLDDAGLATLTFTQAERGNPIDAAFCRDFRIAMNQLWLQPGLRGLLIRAKGPHFSFGGDIKFFASQVEHLPRLIVECTSDLHMGLARAWRLPVPVVAEVQGWAMGGAVAVLAGADIVVAGTSARFGSAFAQLGFSCDSGTSVTLSMRMGAARARRFTMLAEVLDSAAAERCGLADEVVADAELSARAQAVARQLAAGPTLALGEIKRLFLAAGAGLLETQLEDEARTLAKVAASADARGAVQAFARKERFEFNGN